MKLPKLRFPRNYQVSKRSRPFGLEGRPYLLPIFGLVLGVAIVGVVTIFGQHDTLRPESAHVVFLTDNGHQETIDTKADTVGELISRLPLNLIPQDVVEPAANTQIVEDNFRINIYRARPVTVITNGQKIVTLTGERSARVIAAQAGLNVFPEDKVDFAPGNITQGILGEEVVVTPSTPLMLNLYGTNLTVRTQAHTVADLLAEKQIKLAAGDSVKPGLTTAVTANIQVYVLRKGSKFETVAHNIPAPVQNVNDPTLTFGVSVVRQPGSPGKKLVTYLVTAKNGQQVLTPIQGAIVQDPVPEVIAHGTNVDIPTNKTTIMNEAGISPGDQQYANFIVSHESQWSPTAENPSGAYGLCQSLPGSKMASAGADWQVNPVTQMRWCAGYAASKYGGWGGAYEFWLNHAYW